MLKPHLVRNCAKCFAGLDRQSLYLLLLKSMTSLNGNASKPFMERPGTHKNLGPGFRSYLAGAAIAQSGIGELEAWAPLNSRDILAFISSTGMARAKKGRLETKSTLPSNRFGGVLPGRFAPSGSYGAILTGVICVFTKSAKSLTNVISPLVGPLWPVTIPTRFILGATLFNVWLKT